jgi:glycosyltransferase involved in cell wall biosynthesis
MSDNKLKSVLVVTSSFWPETFRINEVVAGLANRDLAVTVLTGLPNYPEGRLYDGYDRMWPKIEQACGAEVIRVPHLLRGKGRVARLALASISFVASACTLGAARLRGRQFDAILCYGVSPIFTAIAGLWLGRLCKAPLALWVQDLWPGNLAAANIRTGSFLETLIGKGVGWLYRSSDMILVSSQAFASDITRRAGQPVACIYQPNSAEQAVLHAAPDLSRPADGTFDVVFAGNLGRALSLPTILDAAQRLSAEPSIRFRIIGEGSMSGWLREELHNRALSNVIIEGKQDPAAMPAIYERASALLLTLTRNPAMELSLPSKTPTYLASGRPVIVAADGETARIISEAGAGICVPAEDGAALANAIRRLRDMPAEQRRKMGEAGRAYARAHFDPERLTDQLIGHLQTAATNYQSKESSQ